MDRERAFLCGGELVASRLVIADSRGIYTGFVQLVGFMCASCSVVEVHELLLMSLTFRLCVCSAV